MKFCRRRRFIGNNASDLVELGRMSGLRGGIVTELFSRDLITHAQMEKVRGALSVLASCLTTLRRAEQKSPEDAAFAMQSRI